MALVVRVLDGLDEIGVAPNAAAVFGWAGTFSINAKGILLPRLLLRAALEQNLVIPGIAEVVLVDEPEFLAVFRDDVAQVRGRGVFVFHLLEVVLHEHGIAVILFADLEVVQVRVGPAHRRLDVFVELVERAVLDLMRRQIGG